MIESTGQHIASHSKHPVLLFNVKVVFHILSDNVTIGVSNYLLSTLLRSMPASVNDGTTFGISIIIKT